MESMSDTKADSFPDSVFQAKSNKAVIASQVKMSCLSQRIRVILAGAMPGFLLLFPYGVPPDA